MVAAVTTDGAAARAGIQENDILDSANGALVPAGGAWRRWLSQLPVGEAVKMRVRRGTEMLDIEITPGAKLALPIAWKKIPTPPKNKSAFAMACSTARITNPCWI